MRIGNRPHAPTVNVAACRLANTMTAASRFRNRRNGAMRQTRKARRSTANESTTPLLMKIQAASCHARVERHGSGPALELVSPDDAACREELQPQLEPPPELRCHVRSDREVRLGRLDRIFETRSKNPWFQKRSVVTGSRVRPEGGPVRPHSSERLVRQE